MFNYVYCENYRGHSTLAKTSAEEFSTIQLGVSTID